MTYPTVPQRSRVSAERTFLSYYPLDDLATKTFTMSVSSLNGMMTLYTTHAMSLLERYYIVDGDDLQGMKEFRVIETSVTGDPNLYKIDIEYTGPDYDVTFAIITADDTITTGQAIDISEDQQLTMMETAAIGTQTIREVSEAETKLNISLFVDDDAVIAKLLGYTTLPKRITMNYASVRDVFVMLRTYKDKQLMTIICYNNVKWETFNKSLTAGKKSYNTWKLSGRATDTYILTENN